MLLASLLLLGGMLAYLFGWRPQENQTSHNRGRAEESALEILSARYARGEISREEYEQMRADLTH